MAQLPMAALEDGMKLSEDEDNCSCQTPIMPNKHFLEFVQSSKNTIVPDSDDEIEMNNAAPVSYIIRNEELHEKSFCFGASHQKPGMDEKRGDVKGWGNKRKQSSTNADLLGFHHFTKTVRGFD
ncbi:hypothetical protein TNCV_3604161 [Trichonephila clavipes]|nr:hypothetical protein TNCV_3604161 [Trichonephila clavipes]